MTLMFISLFLSLELCVGACEFWCIHIVFVRILCSAFVSFAIISKLLFCGGEDECLFSYVFFFSYFDFTCANALSFLIHIHTHTSRLFHTMNDFNGIDVQRADVHVCVLCIVRPNILEIYVSRMQIISFIF